MNPIIVKIISSLISSGIENLSGASPSGSGNDKLFSDILKSMNAAEKSPAGQVNKRLRPGASDPTNRPLSYIASLQNALLAKGKPLSRISLKGQDLPLMHEFLRSCGFSRKDVDRFLKELTAGGSEKELNLSSFFRKISALDARRNKNKPGSLLDPSAVPHLEGVLRQFGLTPRELERALGAARVASGRLDLDKLISKLKQISRQAKGDRQGPAVQKLNQQLADKLRKLEIHIPAKEKNGRMSLQDFIALLERKVGRPDAASKLPPGVQTTMDQLLAKVVVAGEKTAAALSQPLAANPNLADLHFQAKMEEGGKSAANDILHAPFASEGEITDRGGLWSPLRKAGKSKANGRFRAAAVGEGKPHIENKQAKHATSGPVSKAELVSKLNGGWGLRQGNQKENQGELPSKFKGNPGFNQGVKEKTADFKLPTKAIDISQQAPGGTQTEASHAGTQAEKPSQNFLPTYLVGQIGRQISRALLKGDPVIRLRLKPPELGAVKIEMAIKDNVLRLEILAENSAVKEILMSNVHELREALMGQGVEIEQLDVQVGHDFNQSLAHSEEGLNERQRMLQEQTAGSSAAENDDDSIPEPRGRASRDGLLSLVA